MSDLLPSEARTRLARMAGLARLDAFSRPKVRDVPLFGDEPVPERRPAIRDVVPKTDKARRQEANLSGYFERGV